MNSIVCRYCGRVGENRFVQMRDGEYRCQSAGTCQRRIRTEIRRSVADWAKRRR